jgi:hypothetical protein
VADTRRLLAIASFIIIIVALGAPPCRAQDVPPTIEVKAPGRGPLITKPRHFVAVPVLVENPGNTDLRAQLKVYRPVDGRNASPWQSVYYERTIAVPRGGKTVERLVYYCQDGDQPQNLCVSLEPQSGPAVTVFPTVETKVQSVLVLSLTGEPGTDPAAYVFQSARVSCPGRVFEVIERKAEQTALPERPEGYEPWDAVVISDAELASLGNHQKPLLDWIRQGGDAIVYAAKGSTRPIDGAILPVRAARAGEPTEERTLDDLRVLDPQGGPPGGGKVPVRRVELEAGADLIAGTTEAPLIARRRLGAGRITYLAFPIDAAPIERWGTAGRRALVDTLLRPPREDLVGAGAPAFEELLQALSACIRQVEPPSGLLVGPLLTIYVLLVAPLNYFILSRLGRRELSFGSAGALALVFSAAFYGIGVIYKGSQSLTARSGIIQLATRLGEPSGVETITGQFSTDTGIVDGTAPAGAAIAPIAEVREGREAHVSLPFGGVPELRSVQLAMWDIRRFRERHVADLGAAEIDLAFKGDGRFVRGIVKNSTKLPLVRPTLYVAGGVIPIADTLEAGASKNIEDWPREKDEYRLAFPSELLAGISPTAARALSEAASQAAQSGFAGGFGIPRNIQDPSPTKRVLGMIERRLSALDAAPDAVPALLVAWTDGDVDGIDLGPGGKREFQRSLVLVETQVRLLPSERKAWADIGHLQGRVFFERGWNASTCTLAPPSDSKLAGELDLEWRLPSGGAAPVKAADLTVHPRIRVTGNEEWILSVWDWNDDAWHAFFQGRGNSDDRDPPKLPGRRLDAYVDGTSGKVRLKIELKSESGDIVIDGITLTAKVAR